MSQNVAETLESQEFLEFVNREFEQTVLHASVEELAEFSFGSVDEAIAAFRGSKGTAKE